MSMILCTIRHFSVCSGIFQLSPQKLRDDSPGNSCTVSHQPTALLNIPSRTFLFTAGIQYSIDDIHISSVFRGIPVIFCKITATIKGPGFSSRQNFPQQMATAAELSCSLPDPCCLLSDNFSSHAITAPCFYSMKSMNPCAALRVLPPQP